MEPTQVVVGDVEAGRSAKIKREVNRLIKGVSEVTFDLADLLYEIKSKNFFAEWGFTSFSQYLKSLIEQGMKYSKSYYLYRIKENCVSAGLKPKSTSPSASRNCESFRGSSPQASTTGCRCRL